MCPSTINYTNLILFNLNTSRVQTCVRNTVSNEQVACVYIVPYHYLLLFLIDFYVLLEIVDKVGAPSDKNVSPVNSVVVDQDLDKFAFVN